MRWLVGVLVVGGSLAAAWFFEDPLLKRRIK